MRTSPEKRKELKHRLRHFLLNGQRTWRADGGVVVSRSTPDPSMVPIWDCILAARERRPEHRIPWGKTVDGHVGTFWDIEDFKSLPAALHDQLAEL